MTRTDVVRLRPHRIRIVCWIGAAAVLVLFTFIATGLRGPTGQTHATFQRGDQFAMIGLGVLIAAGILLFTRPRVEADIQGVQVRNVFSSHYLPWEVVRSVSFRRGAAWASLELHDDDSLPMIALQVADKERAVAGVRALRELYEAHRAQRQPAGD